MAKRFKSGDSVYVPVKIDVIEQTDKWYDYIVRIPDSDGGRAEFPFCVKDEEVKTAEEVVKENYPFWDGVKQMDRITALEAENASLKESLHEASEENLANDEALAQMNIKKTELQAENGKLKQQLADANELLSDAQAQVKELTEADCMRVQEFKPIVDERDRLKGELEQEKKRTQVWKDASEDHRKRSEELEGDVRRYEQDISEEEVKNQRLEKENNSLKADIIELKAQIAAFQSDPQKIEALKKRINMLEKLKSVHVKTIRRLTRQLKEKDFVISALVKKGIELEEGGESNG